MLFSWMVRLSTSLTKSVSGLDTFTCDAVWCFFTYFVTSITIP